MKSTLEQDIHTICFKSDQYVLKGTLHTPDIERPPIVIGCHGLLADRSSPKQKALAIACVNRGIAYFRFDHRGCGESQGEFESVTTLDARCRDLSNAIRLLRGKKGFKGDIGLFGSSMGGTVCLSMAAVEGITCLATFAAPLHSRLPRSAGDSHLPVFDIRKQAEGIENIHIFHGYGDDTVPLSHSKALYSEASHPKKLTVFPGGDHRMSNPSHQDQFIKGCLNWFSSFLNPY